MQAMMSARLVDEERSLPVGSSVQGRDHGEESLRGYLSSDGIEVIRLELAPHDGLLDQYHERRL